MNEDKNINDEKIMDNDFGKQVFIETNTDQMQTKPNKKMLVVLSEFYSYSQILLFVLLIPIFWWQMQAESSSLAYWPLAIFAGILAWVIFPLVVLINIFVLLHLSRNKSSVIPQLFILGGTCMILVYYLYISSI